MDEFNGELTARTIPAIARGLKGLLDSYAMPYRELMAYYQCALMEVETKFRVLDVQMSLNRENNPIESIKTRLKSPESIFEKLKRRDLPMTLSAIEENLNDIAGVRVICSFPEDIYLLADALLRQDKHRHQCKQHTQSQQFKPALEIVSGVGTTSTRN